MFSNFLIQSCRVLYLHYFGIFCGYIKWLLTIRYLFSRHLHDFFPLLFGWMCEVCVRMILVVGMWFFVFVFLLLLLFCFSPCCCNFNLDSFCLFVVQFVVCLFLSNLNKSIMIIRPGLNNTPMILIQFTDSVYIILALIG